METTTLRPPLDGRRTPTTSPAPTVGGTRAMTERMVANAAERALAIRLADGDQGALAELYDTYSPLVYGLALRVTGDRTAAEDIAQEVFVGLWENPGRFDPDRGTLRAFLGTLTHRRSVDLIRREEARRRREQRTSTEQATSTPALVDELALTQLTAETVRAAVAELPPTQRQALELAYFGGRSYREVAVELGIPEGTAKSRLRLALQRIADLLQPQWSEPNPNPAGTP
jgi:RNA polymerase sigma factor (sigma-70 family)